MSTLKNLIPAEFFVKPPVTGNRDHGKISIQHNGKILVEWPRDCKLFKQNLEAARKLKELGLGTYQPTNGGWVFYRNAAQEVDNLFPDTLVRTPDFVALANSEDGKIIENDSTTTTTKKHGAVTFKGNQFFVVWGNNGTPIPRDKFARYLASARDIKNTFPGSSGWHQLSKGWHLSKTAANAIFEAFPVEFFDHCEELTASITKEVNQEQNNDDVTNNLLNAADLLFSTIE